MKIANTVFFLLLLILIGCSKTAVQPGQADAFIKFYGNSWTDEGNDVVQLADGGYIMIGTTTTMEGDEDIALVRTDQYGNEQWAKFFGGPGDDQGNSVRTTTDGGFILLGSYHDTLAQENNLLQLLTALEQFSCPCQRQPFTKMTFLCRGSVMSGFPGRSFRYRRNRYPILWSNERTINSGLVFLPPTLDIIRLLFPFDSSRGA